MIGPIKVSGAPLVALAFSALTAVASGARAQGYDTDYDYGAAAAYGAQPEGQEPPIPPNVEGQAVPAPGGGYCYVGPHPVDTRVVPGAAFEEVQGQHVRPYAPVDLRLFSFRDGCYYFIGDPRDFGYAGQSYSYYGAHPVLDTYGGGWCFMMGGHYHLWQPWSPYFTVVGPWSYWSGPYDPFFWSYWPYYSFYYRSYYPSYYAGGASIAAADTGPRRRSSGFRPPHGAERPPVARRLVVGGERRPPGRRRPGAGGERPPALPRPRRFGRRRLPVPAQAGEEARRPRPATRLRSAARLRAVAFPPPVSRPAAAFAAAGADQLLPLGKNVSSYENCM